MGIIIDIILIAIIGLTVLYGYKRGLVEVAFKIFSFLVSILISLILFFPISNYIIRNYNIDENIEKAILTNVVKEQNSTNSEKEVNEDSIILKYINKNIKETTDKAKQEIIEIAAKEISIKIINIGIIIILYIITRIILIFAKNIAEMIANLPILKQFNELGGAIYGLLKSMLIIYVVLAVIMLLSSMTDLSFIVQEILNSRITSILYNNNLIIMLLF